MTQKSQSQVKNQPNEDKDPFLGLKYIAYCRSKMPPTDAGAEIEDTDLINYAKWQICKSRNILYKDPVWDEYTAEEVLIEYFTIRFDEDPDECESFVNRLKGVAESDYEWFEQMEKKYLAEKEAELKEVAGEETEFEDTF